MRNIKIGDQPVGDGQPAYIIAEVGSNFDGSLEQAKKLVDLSKECGADAIKFQSFIAEKIICKESFTDKVSFQAKWGKPVSQVYEEAEFPRDWHQEISDYCGKKGIIFFSSPYDKEAVDLLEEIDVPAYKIGSGDINFLSLMKYMAEKGKPIILGTGASTMGEIDEAVKTIRAAGNEDIVLLQCITNYPSPIEQANIRAMVTLRNAFQVNVGYSDHTPGSLVPLGAVALGGCMIEKHFTLDKSREGPDHPFAMDVPEFKQMVQDVRNMEKALGSYVKEPVEAEKETIILQKRCIYAAKDIPKGTVIGEDMLAVLRPDKGLKPKLIDIVIGRESKTDIKKGEPITWDKI